MHGITLKTTNIETPLGKMMAVADNKFLYLLEFMDHKKLKCRLADICKKVKAVLASGETEISALIKEELKLCFTKQLTRFTTPLYLLGSEFQKNVWTELQNIPFSETRSYALLAKNLNKPTAFRAVANANGANRLAIVVPCHRVINSNGNLGGYGGGVHKKEWLLEHEK